MLVQCCPLTIVLVRAAPLKIAPASHVVEMRIGREREGPKNALTIACCRFLFYCLVLVVVRFPVTWRFREVPEIILVLRNIENLYWEHDLIRYTEWPVYQTGSSVHI